jgi:NAD(P)-dependent dehydrogenase (short-subunit alcohol dehydrogenase family)
VAESNEIERFRQTLEVNLVGTMRMCFAAKKDGLAAAKGVIIHTASMLSFLGSPFVPAYSASIGAKPVQIQFAVPRVYCFLAKRCGR